MPARTQHTFIYIWRERKRLSRFSSFIGLPSFPLSRYLHILQSMLVSTGHLILSSSALEFFPSHLWPSYNSFSSWLSLSNIYLTMKYENLLSISHDAANIRLQF